MTSGGPRRWWPASCGSFRWLPGCFPEKKILNIARKLTLCGVHVLACGGGVVRDLTGGVVCALAGGGTANVAVQGLTGGEVVLPHGVEDGLAGGGEGVLPRGVEDGLAGGGEGVLPLGVEDGLAG